MNVLDTFSSWLAKVIPWIISAGHSRRSKDEEGRKRALRSLPGKFVTPFIAMVTLLVAVGYPHLAFAEACNNELAQDMRVQCHQNVEINDSVGASVYCTEAGKQVGICAAELTGEGHYVDLVIKVKLLYSARLANLLLRNHEAADDLQEAIVDGAHEVLRSSYARSDDRAAMKTLLGHMSL